MSLPPPGRCHIELELEVLWAPLPFPVHVVFCHWDAAVTWKFGCCCVLLLGIGSSLIRFSSSLVSSFGVLSFVICGLLLLGAFVRDVLAYFSVFDAGSVTWPRRGDTPHSSGNA